MLDPTILGALAAATEKALDAVLRYDPGSRAALAELAGKVIAIDSTFPTAKLYLCPQAADAQPAVVLRAFSDTPADVQLTGALPALFSLLFSDSRSLSNSGVSVTGDTALLARLQNILKELDIDWEQPLTEVLGNSVGHSFAQLLRQQAGWVRSSSRKAQEFGVDYLVEELRVTPSRNELEGFFADIAELSSAVDRLAARVALLTAPDSGRGK